MATKVERIYSPASGTDLITVAFVVLKLTGHIQWSWWWVLSPIWITLSLALVLFTLAYALVD